MAAHRRVSAPDDRRSVPPEEAIPRCCRTRSANPAPTSAPSCRSAWPTDPFKQITEMIGSGPYRFKADERVPGARVVFEPIRRLRAAPGWRRRFHRRAQAREFRPGRVAHDSRSRTTLARCGRRDRLVGYPTPTCCQCWARRRPRSAQPIRRAASAACGNHLQPPFDNPALRRAVLAAINQEISWRPRGQRPSQLARRCRRVLPGPADG